MRVMTGVLVKLNLDQDLKTVAAKVMSAALENERVVVAMRDRLTLTLFGWNELIAPHLVGATDTESQAMELIESQRATMLVVDAGELAAGYGLNITRRHRALKSVALLRRETPEAVAECLDAGVNGVVLISTVGDGDGDMLKAMGAVGAGATYIPGDVREKLEVGDAKLRRRLLAELTERELEALRLLASGLTNGEMAEAMSVSMDTVKSHVKAINQKTRAENRVALALMAIRAELG
jgi:DNA-binding NarL/FixJ family response regulator